MNESCLLHTTQRKLYKFSLNRWLCVSCQKKSNRIEIKTSHLIECDDENKNEENKVNT